MDNIAPQIGKLTVGAAKTLAIDFSGQLESGELLTGTPTLVMCSPGSPNEITLSNVAVNTATLSINGSSVVAGKAVQALATGVTKGKYMLKATCGSDSTPAQTLIGYINVTVNNPC